MKTLTIKTLILGMIIVSVLTASLWAQPGQRGPQGQRGQGWNEPPEHHMQPGPPPGPRQGGMILPALRRLDLTEEQWEQVKDITETKAEGAKAAQQALREAQQGLQETVASEGSEEEIKAAVKFLADAITAEALLRVAVTKQIKEVLTEEQLQKLAELKERAKAMRQQRQRMHSEGDDGPRGPGSYDRRGRDAGQRRGGGYR